jgi:hypothetical protein
MQRDVIVATILEDRRAQPFGLVQVTLLERTQRLPLQALQVRHLRGSAFELGRQNGQLRFGKFVLTRAAAFAARALSNQCAVENPIIFYALFWSATCIEIT